MNKKLVMLSLMGMTLASEAAKIVWVSDNGAEGSAATTGTGSDGVVRGAVLPAVSGDIPYVDQGFVDLLLAAGHTVDRFNPQSGSMSIDDVPVLNSYDLIILGAALNSGPFNLNSRGAKWNTLLYKPMIVTKATLVRRDRMGYLLDNKEYDCGADKSTTASGKLSLLVPENPIFSGLATTEVAGVKVMNSFCNVIVPSPLNNRGTSSQFFNLAIDGADQGVANAVEPGGVVLATIRFNPMDPGVGIPAGQAPAVNGSHVADGYAIVEWPAGNQVRTTQVAGEVLAGYRMLFSCGTRDASGSSTSAPNPQAGAMDLSADGQAIFVKAVAHSLSQPLPPNTWTNTSTDSSWNDNSANWSMPSVWGNGDALFGDVAAGPVTLTSPVTARKVSVNADGYSFNTVNGNSLTLAGSQPTLEINADVTLAVSLQGTEGLTIEGSKTLTLEGDPALGLGNQYSGGTFIRGGTVVLKAPTGVNGTTSYALDNIDALDAGATVKFYNAVDLSVPAAPANLRVPNGQMGNRRRLIMTGGTFDVAGDDSQNQVPAPDGTGLITNSSPYSRGVMKMGSDPGVVHTFSGIIADGAAVTESVVSGKQGFRTDIDLQGFADDSATLVLTGLNTFTGFTRIGGGKLTFEGNGRWGVPTNTGLAATSSPNGTVICNGNVGSLRVDFNGTSQIAGGLSGNGGVFANNKEGTVSTLTVGAADISNTAWPTGGAGQNGKITDNTTGSGGTVALTKVGTGTIGLPTAQSDYSGPTTISGGTLEFTATGAPSPNSEMRIAGTGLLKLSYSNSKPVKALVLNGVKQPGGVYGAAGSPAPVIGTALITGSGTVTVPTVPVSYSDWADAVFPSSQEAPYKAPTADPDSDGLTNLMEFALGTSPVAFTAAPAAVAVKIGAEEFLSISWIRPSGSVGITTVGQVSLDANTWSSDVAEVITTITDLGGGQESVSVRDAKPVGAAGVRFLRVKVTKDI